MKKNERAFVSAFKTKNKNVEIFRTKTVDEKTFAFVSVEKINEIKNSMKKKMIENQQDKFLYHFLKNLLF